jgi:hypothetical protein
MLQRGALTAESLVQREDMDSWLPAGEIGQLFADGTVVPSDDAQPSESPVGRPAFIPILFLGALCLAAGGMLANKLLSGSGGDPYAYRPVSGAVLYEDGQVIPADVLTLTFVPLVPPHNTRTYPRPGLAHVDPKTGTFQSATSRKAGDGLVQGGHKVLITGANRLPLPDDIVPLEYTDFKTTPLHVDTETGELNLKVKRPLPKPKSVADTLPEA